MEKGRGLVELVVCWNSRLWKRSGSGWVSSVLKLTFMVRDGAFPKHAGSAWPVTTHCHSVTWSFHYNRLIKLPLILFTFQSQVRLLTYLAQNFAHAFVYSALCCGLLLIVLSRSLLNVCSSFEWKKQEYISRGFELEKIWIIAAERVCASFLTHDLLLRCLFLHFSCHVALIFLV